MGRPGFAAEGMGPVSFWIACCCCCCFCCCCCCCFGTGRLGVAPPETPADSPVPSVGLTLLLLGVSCCRARHESSPRVSGCFCCCCCCCCCCFATGRLGAAPPLLSGLGSLAADRLAAGLPVLPGSFAPVRLGAGWPGCWDACGAGCAVLGARAGLCVWFRRRSVAVAGCRQCGPTQRWPVALRAVAALLGWWLLSKELGLMAGGGGSGVGAGE